MHELDRADVEAARRLRRDQHLRVARRSRARARPSAGFRRRARAPASAAPPPRTSNSFSRRLARSSMRLGKSQPPPRVGRRPVLVQREVLGERELERRGRGGDGPRGCARCRRRARSRASRRVMSWPSTMTRAALGVAQPGDRVDQLGLAVAVDAGDARRSRPRAPRATRRGPPRARGRRARQVLDARAAARPGSPAASRRGAAPRGRPSSARGLLGRALARHVSIFLPRRSTRDRGPRSRAPR